MLFHLYETPNGVGKWEESIHLHKPSRQLLNEERNICIKRGPRAKSPRPLLILICERPLYWKPFFWQQMFFFCITFSLIRDSKHRRGMLRKKHNQFIDKHEHCPHHMGKRHACRQSKRKTFTDTLATVPKEKLGQYCRFYAWATAAGPRSTCTLSVWL